MRWFQKFLILLILFLTPLIPQINNFGFEHIKVLFFVLIFLVLLSLWSISSLKHKYKIIFNRTSKLGLIFLIVLFFSSIFGINSAESLVGRYPYFQGFIIYLFLYLFYLLIVSLEMKILPIVMTITLSALIVSLVAISQWILIYLFGVNLPTYAGRVVSTFGQPNLYSGFLLLTLPLLYFLINCKNKKLKVLGLSGGVASIVAIILSSSRASILILCGSLLAWFLFKLKFSIRQTIIFITLTSVTILSGAIYFKSGVVWQEFMGLSDKQWLISNSPEKRVVIWQIFIDLISKRPLLGYGLDNIDSAYQNFFAKVDFNSNRNPYYYTLKNTFVNRTHSYFLDILMFSGILGLLSYLIFLMYIFKKTKGSILFIWLIIYLFWISIQIQSIVHLMLFWVVVALAKSKEQLVLDKGIL